MLILHDPKKKQRHGSDRIHGDCVVGREWTYVRKQMGNNPVLKSIEYYPEKKKKKYWVLIKAKPHAFDTHGLAIKKKNGRGGCPSLNTSLFYIYSPK